MFLLMYIFMLNAINMTLQRRGRISLGFLSTKIHKVDQSIHKNIPKSLPGRRRENTMERRNFLFASERL